MKSNVGDLLDLASGTWGNLGTGYSEWRCLTVLFPGNMDLRGLYEKLKLSPNTIEILLGIQGKNLKDLTNAEVQAQIEFWHAVKKRRASL